MTDSRLNRDAGAALELISIYARAFRAGPSRPALIARKNAPANASEARFRYSSLGGLGRPASGNSGWIFADAKINPTARTADTRRRRTSAASASSPSCRPRREAHAEVHRVPLSPLLFLPPSPPPSPVRVRTVSSPFPSHYRRPFDT